ncbi:hypothetical protein Aperf_G00000067339 [Anoplocephala perfoliata]
MEDKFTESVNSSDEFQEDVLPKSTSRWSSYFPYGFWPEWKRLAALAFPMILSGAINYAVAPVTIAFLGHLGNSELAAGGLAISLFHVVGVSFIIGLLTASDTLFPQFTVITETANRYVQAQNKVYPPLCATLVSNAVNAIAHYLFIYHSDFGLVGSALSQSLGFMAQALTMVGYIYFSGLYRETWDAVHIELWHDWGIWFRLAIPGMVMTGLEWWVCESGSILSGLRGETALATQTILNNVESLMYSLFPLGFSQASAIRIGQYLGANNSEGPRSTALIGLITIYILSALVSIIIICVRYYAPRIFSSDP